MAILVYSGDGIKIEAYPSPNEVMSSCKARFVLSLRKSSLAQASATSGPGRPVCSYKVALRAQLLTVEL